MSGRGGGLANRAERRRDYADYLAGDHWETFKADWWKRHPQAVCFVCGGSSPTHLHHLHYRTRGHETDQDVRPLHNTCHAEVHSIERTQHLPIVDATLLLRDQITKQQTSTRNGG